MQLHILSSPEYIVFAFERRTILPRAVRLFVSVRAAGDNKKHVEPHPMIRPVTTPANEPVYFAVRVGTACTALDTWQSVTLVQSGNFLNGSLRDMPITCKFLYTLDFRTMNGYDRRNTQSLLAAWRSPEAL